MLSWKADLPGSWILDLGSLCSLYGRFDNLNQSPDNLFNIHALRFCAIVEQDAMAQRGIGQGADVIQGHVRAAFQERPGLGAEDEELTGSRAGSPTGPLIDEV